MKSNLRRFAHGTKEEEKGGQCKCMDWDTKKNKGIVLMSLYQLKNTGEIQRSKGYKKG